VHVLKRLAIPNLIFFYAIFVSSAAAADFIVDDQEAQVQPTIATDRPTVITIEVVKQDGPSVVHHFASNEEIIFSVDSAGVGTENDRSELTPNLLCAEEHDEDPATSHQLSDQSSSFSELVPKPKLNRGGSSTRKRAVSHAEVLTSTPYKEQLEERNAKKSTPSLGLTKKRSKLTKRELFNSTSDTKDTKTRAKKQTKDATKKRQSKREKPKSKQRIQQPSDSHRSDDNTQASCLYCAELWCESEGSWIRCQGLCKNWAHTACAGVDAKTKHFVCELCQ